MRWAARPNTITADTLAKAIRYAFSTRQQDVEKTRRHSLRQTIRTMEITPMAAATAGRREEELGRRRVLSGDPGWVL